MGFQLSYLHLTITHSKGHGQSHLAWKYLTNGDRTNVTFASKYKLL